MGYACAKSYVGRKNFYVRRRIYPSQCVDCCNASFSSFLRDPKEKNGQSSTKATDKMSLCERESGQMALNSYFCGIQTFLHATSLHPYCLLRHFAS